MTAVSVKKMMETHGLCDRVFEFDSSSATVALAAEALGVSPARIAKTIALQHQDGGILVVAAGDVKIDNSKFKLQFGEKARMLKADEVKKKTGYAVGGVCPFALETNIPVYLDQSLKRFEVVFPAAGSSHSCIRLSLQELERLSQARAWVDVCQRISSTGGEKTSES